MNKPEQPMVAAPAPTETYESRGIYYFEGRIRCPLAGIGSRADHQSNRLVLDDADTRVTVDRDAERITVHNAHYYDDKKIVADLTFLAEGTTVSGAKTDFELHLKIFKNGDEFSTDFHRHMRTQERLDSADFEPFEVVATDGERRIVLTDEDASQQLCTRPSWALRIVRAMMAMRDNLDGVVQDPTRPGYRLVDLSLGFGPNQFGWMMVRARLESLADCSNLLARGSLAEMLCEGSWMLSLTAFTERLLPEVVKRDLFLFGLDEHPLLQDVRRRGLASGQTLAFRFDHSSGEVGLDGRFEPLDGALDVARAYLEFHMLGGLLIEHTERNALEAG